MNHEHRKISLAERLIVTLGVGISLAWLGTLLLIGSVAARAFSVHRPPLGNMYEFAMVGSLFVMAAFLLWSLRHDVRWLGAFATGIVVLFLAWMLALSWPRLTRSEVLMRVAVIVLVLGLTVIKIFPR